MYNGISRNKPKVASTRMNGKLTTAMASGHNQ